MTTFYPNCAAGVRSDFIDFFMTCMYWHYGQIVYWYTFVYTLGGRLGGRLFIIFYFYLTLLDVCDDVCL